MEQLRWVSTSVARCLMVVVVRQKVGLQLAVAAEFAMGSVRGDVLLVFVVVVAGKESVAVGVAAAPAKRIHFGCTDRNTWVGGRLHARATLWIDCNLNTIGL